MINHHPDENLLAEYASGSLAWALSLSVCAHVQLCPHCRQKVSNLNKIGGAMLNTSVAETCAPNSFENLMRRIHEKSSVEKVSEVAATSELHISYRHDPLLNKLPKVVEKLLPANGKLKWQKVSSKLKTARLTAGQNEYEVAFQCISSGGKVVEHDHRGLEITLVLKGSFSDEQGVYSEGDFLVRNPGEIHRPTATLNADCLCLSVVAAPVSVTGLLGHFINPFLSIKPA
ncbi:MAG: ChrR family anti-sigma-E factor [Pseudomonadota bacterium]